MNKEKTRKYYQQIHEEDICSCEYCRNYVKEVKSAYPELSDHLNEMGVDIEKPFETIPVGPVNEEMFYSGVQYVVIGTADDFIETSVGPVSLMITDSHPVTGIEEDHFVIEISPVYLKWPAEQ